MYYQSMVTGYGTAVTDMFTFTKVRFLSLIYKSYPPVNLFYCGPRLAYVVTTIVILAYRYTVVLVNFDLARVEDWMSFVHVKCY